MHNNLKLMGILAHPDDESLGMGGVLAKYGAEGIDTYLITATRGQRGWFGEASEYPGPEALGHIREAELRAAAEKLGLKEVVLLDYMDGELDQAHPETVIRQLAAHVRRLRPQVVVTFDPHGGYGHPDHIAISQFATAAMVAAAQPNGDEPAHQVSKLYYFAEAEESWALYESVFGDLVMAVDGVERRGVPWPTWAITTEIDTAVYWQQVWEAIACHQSQLAHYAHLQKLPLAQQKALWGHQSFYRAYSLVNGGRRQETDFFAGLRS